MLLAEPMTVATDWLLALVVGFWALKLWPRPQASARWWAAAFAVSAAAAAVGGAAHGFAPYLSPLEKQLIWKVTVLSVGLASFCMLVGAGRVSFSPRGWRWLLGAALVKLSLYTVWMLGHDAFIYVIYDYGSAMLLVLALQLHRLMSHGDSAARWVLAGILVAFVGAAVQASKLQLHLHFNHNDLYHLIQIGAFYLLWRGGQRFSDHP